MIDFNALVLGPCMDTFAFAAKVFPVAGGPGAAAFDIRCVYTSRPIDVQMQDGMILSDQETSIGVKLDEIAMPIVRGDRIRFGSDAPAGIIGKTMIVGDVDEDGQGGATIMLRNTSPAGDV